ncbi:putative nicotinate-nucleotide adenylyltransferase [Lentibacillus kapialis]|uniref:Probable nicotinate-nucleotide adenylyltransferase n=1 Tax=Lentibacillus kapialis TaxID=340214 RepID=A0A917PLT8_9BACI|nr:nicotinate-nucleotide adenylyltransferase [Lentibacillus kapialis]GGJ83596.1 putative nicotinate-nucleotide adenylyltransferase [Lentibacillus kapialis]
MKRIGILGGTFDPPHIGHLIIAEEVRETLNLEEVWFIPSYEPPHKQKAHVNSETRVEMVERAISGNPHFRISTIEVNRLGKSYTFDTMKALTDENPDVQFYFIIGADMVEYLPYWNHIDDLLNLVMFVGVKRRGYAFKTDYPILEVDVPLIELSSTDIRQRALKNKSIKYMVNSGVEAYLKEKHLYEDR